MWHLRTKAFVGAAVVVLLAALSAFFGMAASAQAAGVPYVDESASGSVGLCDSSGHALTHGNINDKPFVWRAVSSVAAPDPVNGPGRRATLYAFQPRKKINSLLWSGEKMTSSSTYSNVRYPMAQATLADRKLANFLNDFPPQWNGFVQLRMYLSAPGQQPDPTATYAATDLRISGDTWTVVHGASVPCTDGAAQDTEILTPAQRKGGTGSATVGPRSIGPKGPDSATPAARSGSPAPASGSATGTDSGPVGPGGARTTTRAQPAAAAKSDGSASSTVLAVVLAVAAVGLAAGGVVLWRRRS